MSLTAIASAQTIWDGGAGTGAWGTAANWVGDVLPGSGTAVQFAGNVQTTVDTVTNRTISTLTFNVGADPFSINNNTLTLTGITNSSTSTQTVNSAIQHTASTTYAATSGALVFAGNIALSNSGTSRTLAVSAANDVTITGLISNGGTAPASALTKTGAGTLTLSGANTYGGTTTVSAGTLRATSTASALGAGALSLGTNAILQLANDTGLTFGRNSTVSGNSTVTIDRLTSGAALTHTLGTLSIGSRLLTLTAGSNVASGTAGLTFGNTTITGSARFSPAASTLLTLGSLNATAARAVTKLGAGTLLFNAASTGWVSGSSLTINTGTVQLGASNVFGASSLTNVVVNATTAGATALLDLNGNSQSILALTFGGTGATATSTNTLTTGAGTLTVGGNVTFTSTNNPLGASLTGNLSLGAATRAFVINDSTNAAADLTVSAVVSGAAGAGITKTGTGTLVLSGANTFTGPTAISAGTVSINSLANLSAASALGAPMTAANGTIGIGSTTVAGTLLYSGGAASTDRVVNLAGTTGGAALQHDGTGALTFTSAFTATGLGNKTLTLRGTNTEANTISGAIVNSTGFVTSILKTDAGTWLLSGANTNTGATTVNNGTLRFGSSASLATSAVTVNATTAGTTALLDLNGHNATITTLTFGGTGGTTTSTSNLSTGAGTLTLGGNVTYTTTGNPLGATLSGNLALGAATRTFTVNDSTSTAADLTVSAAITGGAGVGLIKAGAGTLMFSGANTYVGNTSVTAGTLQTTAANSLSASSPVSVSTGATLNLNGFNQTSASLTGAGNITLGSATFTFGGDNASTAYSGIASGTGGVTKNGTGTLTLSGVNTYTGDTTINAGTVTLTAANRLAATTGLTVASGATFNLAGFAQTVGALSGAGNVTQGAGAFIAGDAANTTFSGLLTGTGTFTKQGAGTLTLSGANTVSGALTVADGTLTLSGAAGALASASSITVADGAALTLDSSAAGNADRLGNSAAVTLNGGALTLITAGAGTSENLGALTAGPGVSTILVSQTGAGAGVLTFSSLGLIDDAATVNFTATGGTLGSGATGPQIYITGLGTGFIGGWAVVGTDFAEYDAFGVRALTGYYTGADGINVNSVTQNVILADTSPSTAFTLTNAGTTKDQSLLLTDITAVDLNTDATRTLNLTSGGLLKTTATDTTISGLGRLTAANTAAGSLSVTVQSTGKLTIDSVIVNNAGADGTYGNGDDGAVKVVKSGSGELILNAANTHSGGAQLDAGTLTLGNNSAAGTGALSLNSGTLQTSGGDRTLANAVTLGGNVTLAGANAFTFTGAATLTGDRTLTISADTTFSGVIGESGGARSLTKAGTGTLTLSGSSATTYTGTTTVHAGTLQLGKSSGNALAGPLVVGDGTGTDTVRLLASNQISDTSAVTLNSGAVLDLNNFNDSVGALTLAGGSALTTGTGTLTLTTDVTRSAAGGTAATISGRLALGSASRTFTVADSAATVDLDISAVISGTGALVKAGAGTLGLSGANTYSGATTIDAGTLRTTAAGSLSAASALTVASGAILDLNNFDQSVGSLAGAGAVTLGSATLTGGADNTSTTFSGVVSGSGGLTKSGNGTLTLTTAHTYTGPTTVAAGALRVEDNSALGTTAGGTTVASGATLELNASVNLGTEALTLTGSGVSGGGALRSVSGDNVVNGAVTLGGSATVATDLGSLTLGGALATAGGTLTFASTGDTLVSGVISGSGSLVKTGAGDLTLSAANTYSGTTTISFGTVHATDSSALGTTAGGTTVAAGAALFLDGGLTIGAEALTLSGTGVASSGALRSVSGDNSLSGAITLGAAATITTVADTLSLSGGIATAGHALTFATTGDTTVSGAISGAGSVVKTGAGDLLLSGASSYSGTTTVSTGTLRASHGTALGSTAGGTTVAGGATVELSGDITIGAEAFTLAGTGSGSGALLNVSGHNTLGGALTLTGATTIGSADGSLTLNGSGITFGGNALTFDGAGDITLAIALGGSSGFTKSGTGTLTLAAVLNTTGTVTLAGGTLDLGGLAQTIGTLQVTGDSILDFSGTSTLSLTTLNISSGVKLTITNWVNAVDFFSSTANPGATILNRVEFTGFTTADTKWLDYSGGQISPVPEPSTYGAAFVGLLLACYGVRRWRAASASKSA